MVCIKRYRFNPKRLNKLASTKNKAMKTTDTIETTTLMNGDITKVRAHDGIVGLLYLSSVILSYEFGLEWLYIALGVGILQILSPFTKICPVYMILNKLMPNTTPMQNGK